MEKEDIAKILKLKEEMDKVSDELTRKVSSIDGDVMTIRNNSEVREIWNRLCRLHMISEEVFELGIERMELDLQ